MLGMVGKNGYTGCHDGNPPQCHPNPDYPNNACFYDPTTGQVEAELKAAIDYINGLGYGTVGPVTLDIGGNDVGGDFNPQTCIYSSTWTADLQHMDQNLTMPGGILDQLTRTLHNDGDGDLIVLNYYDVHNYSYPIPTPNTGPPTPCPNSVAYIQQLNQHLAADAAQYSSVKYFVDIYSSPAFNPDGICGDNQVTPVIPPSTSWCVTPDSQNPKRNFHPTADGYTQMYLTVQSTVNY